MDDLQELIHIINRNKVKHIAVIGNARSGHSKVQEFYQLISDGSLVNDEAAARYFYNAGPRNRKYLDLKKRLKDRLYNTALFIDVNQPRYDNMGKAYYSSWKDFAVAKVLIARGSTLASMQLLEKLLKKCLKYEFTELSIDILRFLRQKVATHYFDEKKFCRYNALLQEQLERYQLELQVEEFYASLILDIYAGRHEGVPDKAQAFAQAVEKKVYDLSTYRLRLYYYSILVAGYNEARKFDQARQITEEAIAFFSSNPNYANNATGIFQRKLFLILWQQKKFEAGSELLVQAKRYTRDGDLSYFTNHSYFLLLCLHVGQYQRAYDLLLHTMQHKRFRTLSEFSQEKWRIYQAYLYYLIGLGKIPGLEPKKFRINKFLNEVPNYARDKRGTNIPILIIQILFLLLYRRYNAVIDRMEALEKYTSRHLRAESVRRSYFFIRMLLKIPKADFHRAGAQRKAESFRKKLRSTPLNVTRNAYITEIMPYEILWEYAMDSLDHKFWKPRPSRR